MTTQVWTAIRPHKHGSSTIPGVGQSTVPLSSLKSKDCKPLSFQHYAVATPRGKIAVERMLVQTVLFWRYIGTSPFARPPPALSYWLSLITDSDFEVPRVRVHVRGAITLRDVLQ